MRLWLAIAAVLALCGFAQAQSPGVSPNQMFGCNQSALYDTGNSGATKLVTGTSTTRIYVCGFSFWSAGTGAVGIVYGTGGTCGTGQHEITPAFSFTAQTGIVDHLPVYTGLPPAPVSNDVCLLTTTSVAVQAIVYYSQF